LSILSRYCFALHTENLCDTAKTSFSQIIPTEATSVDCVRLSVPQEIYVTSWTTRQEDNVASKVRLIDASGKSPRSVQRIELRDGFGTKVSTENVMQPEKGNLVFLVTDFGAAATEVRVESYKEMRLNEVFRTEGDSVELLHLNGEALQIAVHHHLNAIDIPDLFQLRNGRFQKCNAQYPQYYQHLLEAQHLSRDSNVAPSLATRFAHLLELSGDSEGAKRQRTRASSVKP
jgi:hypothetical protein